MTSRNRYTREWRAVRSVEDLMALVDQIEMCRRTIYAQAWRGRDPDRIQRIFEEAAEMKHAISMLRDILGDAWDDLYRLARGDVS